MAYNPSASGRSFRVGGLLDLLTLGEYTPDAWNGISDVIEASGSRLVNVCGGFIDVSPFNEYERSRNFGFGLLNPECFDGFIMIGGTMGNNTLPERVAQFVSRFADKPLVSVGPAPHGVAQTHIDNEKGMHDIFRHLMDHHGYRGIAFIRGPEGNEDAEPRFKAYKDCLAERGVAYDPALVAIGDFNEKSGEKGMAAILDAGRALRAVVAANDNMAIGAMKELKRRGRRIPTEVAVAGFDDTIEASSVIPTLTTVKQPIRVLGMKAAELLLSWLESGVKPAQSAIMSAELVIRRSCGCMSASEGKAVCALKSELGIGEVTKSERVGKFEAAIQEVFRSFASPPGSQAARTLAEAFEESLGHEDHFAPVLNQQLEASTIAGNDVAYWQDVLSALLSALHSVTHDGNMCEMAGGIVERARVVIAETATSLLMHERIQIKRQALNLMRVGGELVTSFRIEQLSEVLKRSLPEFGIRTAALFTYNDGSAPLKGCRCVFALRDGVEATGELSGKDLPADARAFEGLKSGQGPDSWMLQPLYYRQDQLGFMVMHQAARSGNIYESFHLQLCGSLEGAALIERSQSMERSLVERSSAIDALVKPMLASLQEMSSLAAKHGADVSRLETVGSENAKKAETAEKVALGIQDMLGKANSLAVAIEDISETIDIVALNASIEAAHAGAFGRGFSVIASEIRKLSDSTKKNVQEITSFLSRTNDGIRGFIGANHELMGAFAGLNEAISRVTGFLSDILGKLDGIQSSSKSIMDTMSEGFGSEK
jgi:DNA-binding LacI/PurR family transcriptional regulator